MSIENNPIFQETQICYESLKINELQTVTRENVAKALDIYIESFDEKKNRTLTKTGKITSRTEAHTLGELHLAAHIWIYNSRGEILLQKRADTVEVYPGLYYISAGGHVDVGETMLQGAIRELHEEVGLEASEASLQLIYEERENTGPTTRNGKLYHNNELAQVFLLPSEKKAYEFKIQEEEVSKVMYLSVDELEQWLHDPVRRAKLASKSDAYYEAIIRAVREAIDK